ncbi:formimidoylglutamate deiminase [Euzebya tangerina]|uniref:formimidoylglutamate deiminase n=1 Tax=Euzebya tangerina TaxID=591198 RepID=UPI000E3241C4|nr:formimidoylglutamate deiminase [Euzebya tangerina]
MVADLAAASTTKTSGPVQTYRCDHALIDGAVRRDVLLGIAEGQVVRVEVEVEPEVARAAGAVHLRGVTLPGLVNAHSHAFHRALRGRVQGAQAEGNFWRWREVMYAAASRLDPDRYHHLALAVFAEMALAGISTVGEFHYLHHPSGGGRYRDPNAMGHALTSAAEEVGIRLTLLDALYLTADVDRPADDPGLSPVQRRFSDGSVHAWADRVGRLVPSERIRFGAAVHSVRAVPGPQQVELADVLAAGVLGSDPVVHAHVAEQPAEVGATINRYGEGPLALLDRSGLVGAGFTAVHGVWLDEEEVLQLARRGGGVCVCPTTERDLGDGVVRADRLLERGVPLSLGTDQHVMTDLFEEARAVELNLRLITGRRGILDPATLLAAATGGGAARVGWPECGRIEVGAPADLCVVGLDGPRLAGSGDLLSRVVFAATAADVRHTVVGGGFIVTDRAHRSVDVAGELQRSVRALVGEGSL